MSMRPAQIRSRNQALTSSVVLPLAAARDFDLIELRSAAGLVAQMLPSGALFALRHGPTLINQFLAGPAENGLFRLIACWTGEAGESGWCPVVGPGLAFGRVSSHAVAWQTSTAGLRCETTLDVHPTLSTWRWRVRVRNESSSPRRVDLLHSQDLGLADEGAVRNNEAYVCHYIDLLPIDDAQFGWVVLARQNQVMSGGKHPWLGVACSTGAAAFCTDGWQFFGADHRLTGEPAAVRMPALPSCRRQYEFAMAGLQSRPLELAPGGEGEVTIVAHYREDHPDVSSRDDVAIIKEAISFEIPPSAGSASAAWIPLKGETINTRVAPLFVSSPWLHGEQATEGDWDAWFPGPRRHVERGSDGRIWSFFHGAEMHVVSREKEAIVERPHGHILRNGDGRWIDEAQFGVTCYAAGVFAAQVYLGNTNIGRLLPVVRNALGLHRAAGQRVFVRVDGEWRQLGVPTAFALIPGSARWIYRYGARTIEARVWCSHELAASFLELRVTAGKPVAFLVSHALALGPTEFEHGGELELHHEADWIGCFPAAESVLTQHVPGACFAIAAGEPASGIVLDDATILGCKRTGLPPPYATLRSGPVERLGVILLGTSEGPAELPVAVAAAREEFAARVFPAHPPLAPFRLRAAGSDRAVTRIDDVLPWFTHNASIHFSAPHGLEQSSGGAWGVRDVCQGSLEWLLAAGEYAVARRMLETVFARQYAADGNWPQWFMHPPFHFIQQPHCHGDVCFWPVKALCDYAEAANDLEFLHQRIRYTDAETFEPCGPEETLLEHCDRVVGTCEARFLPGTALVNYGDGDWDDTLQPADSGMRTRMVSSWTVAFVYHAFRQFAALCRGAREMKRAERVEVLLARMRADFVQRLMPDGVAAGFLVAEDEGERVLLHPRDTVTGIRYRLLPMTRAILGELFTDEEARRHIAFVRSELLYPDGVRLMSEPARYHGGRERLFKRADTAANIGREIGLQYVHAHLRYAEALAKIGDADGLWRAIQVVNPVGLREILAHAAPRQSNVYFSSSDADFPDRMEAARRWDELRSGNVAVCGGWRLYSSGPGLFLRIVRACLLGVRESFGDIVFDPVLPPALDGLVAETLFSGRRVRIVYRVRHATHGARAIVINGTLMGAAAREQNPYREGGLRVARSEIEAALRQGENTIEVEL